jgi:hypothetical protein
MGEKMEKMRKGNQVDLANVSSPVNRAAPVMYISLPFFGILEMLAAVLTE